MSDIIEDTLQEAKPKNAKASNKYASKINQMGAGVFAGDSHQVLLESGSVPDKDFIELDELDELESVNHTINVMSLGPGNLLKSTREEAKLSKEDVAQELRLTVKHIDYLEQDAYHKFPAVAFYIGYLRNYSKFLNLDPNKLIAKFHAVYKAVPEVPVYKKPYASSSVHILKSLNEHWPFNFFVNKDKTRNPNVIKYFLLVVSVVTIISVIWWLVSTVNVRNENAVTASIMQLAPEAVDDLLPTQPVIVKNTVNTVEDAQEQIMLSQSTLGSQQTVDKQNEAQDVG